MRILFAIILYTVPADILQAQAVTLGSILTMIGLWINPLVLAGATIAFLVFVWGIVRMMIAMNTGESDKAIAEGKQRMVWGLVGLFMVMSIWGIVALLMTMFGAGGVTTGTPPIIST